MSTSPDEHPHTDTPQTDAPKVDVPQTRPSPASVRHTRISGTWVAIIVAVIVLVFLLIFILQNLANATVSFLGAGGTLPLGVAMLLAAVAGALLVSLVGTARILQLRRHTGKQRRTIASKKAKQH